MRRRTQDALEARSPIFLKFFGRLFERDLRATFHAVRCSGPTPPRAGPMLVFANHPSWWDGELFVWLAATMFAKKRCFAPIEAAMLERYRFFGKLGAFAVPRGHAGAAMLRAMGEAVLAHEEGLLLVNAEGRFRDVRARPLETAPGIAHLARQAPAACIVPLAVEYGFWDERRPNLFLRFGEPVPMAAILAEKSHALDEALTMTMDALAADVALRDASRFSTLLAGTTRINAAYDLWRRGKALLKGERFDPAHGAKPDVLSR